MRGQNAMGCQDTGSSSCMELTKQLHGYKATWEGSGAGKDRNFHATGFWIRCT